MAANLHQINGIIKGKGVLSKMWKVRGRWQYRYRVVDKAGQTVAVGLTAQRDRHAAPRFLEKASRGHGVPATITIDQSEANAAIERGNAEAKLTQVATY